jgi:hypothetical protein
MNGAPSSDDQAKYVTERPMRVPPIPVPPPDETEPATAVQKEDAKAKQAEPVEDSEDGFAAAVAETVVNIFTDLLSDS